MQKKIKINILIGIFKKRLCSEINKFIGFSQEKYKDLFQKTEFKIRFVVLIKKGNCGKEKNQLILAFLI